MPQGDYHWNPFERYEDGNTPGGIVYRNQRGRHEAPPLGLQIPHDLDWMRVSLCLKSDLDFASALSHGTPKAELRIMRSICERCPVQEECFYHGIEVVTDLGSSNHVGGMWGGYLAKELPLPRRNGRPGRRHTA